MVFGAVRTSRSASESSFYLRGLLMGMIGAFFLGWLLLTLPGLGYWARVRTVTLAALAAGMLTRLPDWNWWGFSTSFTLAGIADLVITWFLAGLVIAAFARRK